MSNAVSGFAPCGSALALCAVLHRTPLSAEPRWIKARLGSFEAISDDGRRSATQALSQFEQFSFALGTAMGQPDLRLDPPSSDHRVQERRRICARNVPRGW